MTTNPVATNANGDAAFAGVSLNKIGSSYALRATSTAAPAQTATSHAFNIIAAGAASIGFSTGPSDALAGVAIFPSIVVNLQDAFGNPVANQTVALAIANNAGSGVLSGGGNQQTDVDGNATCAASIDKVGAGYTLGASFGELDATSDAFDITPGIPTRLVFVEQPEDLPAGTTTSAKVSIEDDFGNVDTGDDTTQISLSVNACGTTLLRTATVVDGTATFAGLRFNTVTDPASLKLTASKAGDLSADSDTFVVEANDDSVFWNGFESCVP